jgi:hypothetical protein
VDTRDTTARWSALGRDAMGRVARGRWCVLVVAAAVACVLVAAPAGGSDTVDLDAFRPRITEALNHFLSGAKEMQCSYPSKRRWWESLSEEGIEVVSTRNSRALFSAVRECLKITEVESGDVERSKAVLTEFLTMRRAAESAAGVTKSEGHAEKIMRERREQAEKVERERRKQQEQQQQPSVPPTPVPSPNARVNDDGEQCRDGWLGEDCDRCAPGYGGEHCLRIEADGSGCMPGWTGEDCDECAPGHGGELCEPLAGVAGEDHDCMEGWTGEDCDECAPGHGGELCAPLAKQEDNDCMEGWTGEDCDECAPGFSGPRCQPA